MTNSYSVNDLFYISDPREQRVQTLAVTLVQSGTGWRVLLEVLLTTKLSFISGSFLMQNRGPMCTSYTAPDNSVAISVYGKYDCNNE